MHAFILIDMRVMALQKDKVPKREKSLPLSSPPLQTQFQDQNFVASEIAQFS
jgi:hypothetical protein